MAVHVQEGKLHTGMGTGESSVVMGKIRECFERDWYEFVNLSKERLGSVGQERCCFKKEN